MKKYDYIVSLVMLAVSGYVFYETSGYDVGTSWQKNPGIWPMFLAGCLALLSVLLFLTALLRKEDGSKETVISWTSPGMKRVYCMVGFLVAFVIIMNIAGMLVGVFLILPAVAYLMGCRNKKALVLLPVCALAFVYIFFCLIMQVSFPGPFWA